MAAPSFLPTKGIFIIKHLWRFCNIEAKTEATQNKETVMDFYIDETMCWRCGRNGTKDPLDGHHIFGGPCRKKSEQLGLVVPLCHSRCHQFGKYSAHQNPDTAQRLHEFGQRKAMYEQGWTVRQFVTEFGKNYLDVAPDDWDKTIDQLEAPAAKGKAPGKNGTIKEIRGGWSFLILDTDPLPF
jgi:hypothetical protein